MNERTAKLIEDARKRTAELLAKQAEAKATSSLPSSASIVPMPKLTESFQSIQTELTKVHKNLAFDPFEFPGIGRANAEQAKAIQLFGIDGECGCLIGPAGTGKTTTMKALINAAILSGRIPILSESLAHKYLHGGVPGIYGGSFTRIATRNLRNNFPADLQCNVHTIHRLLEFEPEMFEVEDLKNPGKMKMVRLFKPTRNKFRTLPAELMMLCLDESSMIGYSRLHTQLIEALHPASKPQILYIGDIAQIPPVMDDAVLGYKMLEFMPQGKLVELTQVYRHAGAIVNLATRIRQGKTIPSSNDVASLDNKKEYPDERYMLPYNANPRKLPFKYTNHALKLESFSEIEDKVFRKEEDGSVVTIKYWRNRLDGEVGQLRALQNLGVYVPATSEKPEQLGFFPKEIAAGKYNPLTDMILIPYNKAVGTIEMNKYIAQYLGKMRNAVVHEIIAGSQKHYLAVGDKIYVDREEALITNIKHNGLYAGRVPQKESVTLDRWGHNQAGAATELSSTGGGLDDLELLLSVNISDDEEERKNQASHHVYFKKLTDIEDQKLVINDPINLDSDFLYKDTDKDDYLATAAEFNSMGINNVLFSYALTIHKSQGSQWKKVYCVFHNSHNRNLQRELLYTAITRAQKELFVIAEPETFIQGVNSQHIIGNTLAEKAEYFKGKVQENDNRADFFKKG